MADLSRTPCLSSFTTVVEAMKLLLSSSDHITAASVLVSHGSLAKEACWDEIHASGAVEVLLNLLATGTRDVSAASFY